MDVERETIVEIAASAIPVLLLSAAIVGVGIVYAESGNRLSATGGTVLVGVLVAFVLAMTGVGLYLAHSDY